MSTSPKPTLREFKDSTGKWRWSWIASNGNIIATSSQGYVRKKSMQSSQTAMFHAIKSGEYHFKPS